MQIPVPSHELLEDFYRCAALAGFVAAGIRVGLRGARARVRAEMMALREEHLDDEERRIERGEETRIVRIVRKVTELTIGERLDHLHDCLHEAREEGKTAVHGLSAGLRLLAERVQSHGEGLGRVDDRLTALERKL